MRPALALILVFLSGAAALGYQMIWIRLFSAGLGHEVPAIVGVIAAFLGGMALGAAASDRLLAGVVAPARWFIRVELAIAVWGVISGWLIPVLNEVALGLLGPAPGPLFHWLIVFALPGLALLPATLAMGATLPIMLRCLQGVGTETRIAGAVYGANTLGGAGGALVGTFLLMPLLGLRGSLFALALANVVVAIGVGKLGSVERPMVRGGNVRVAREQPNWRWTALAFVGGFLAIAFELIGIRGLSQVLDNTAYTYATVLAVYLAGTALGGAWYQRGFSRQPAAQALPRLLFALAGTGALAAWALRLAPDLHARLRELIGNMGPFGDSLGGVLLVELTLAATVFGPATILMGALFSLVLEVAARQANGTPGRVLMWNTLGCVAAAATITLWGIPTLGLRGGLIAITAGYGAAILLAVTKATTRQLAWRPLLALGLIPLFPGALNLLRPPEGSTIAEQHEGVLASAAVLASSDGHRTLRINNRLQMGGTSSALAQRREAHLPLLLHPAPRNALFIGPGTGITLGAAAAHPGLAVTAVELLPEVVQLMPRFQPENGGPFPNDRVRLQVADARRFVRTDSNRYDVIVADLFHPALDGAGFLYTREHFEAVRQRLSDTGIFCQWLPLHQLDEATLRIIIRTFVDVFSEAEAFLLHFNVDIPVLGLVGGRGRPDLDPTHLDQRVSAPDLRVALRGVGLDKTLSVLGCWAGDARALRRFAGASAAATDLNPAVLFAAPRHSARRAPTTYGTLFAWLDAIAAGGGQRFEPPDWPVAPEFAEKLKAYLRARDLYLRGLAVETGGDLRGAIDLYLDSSRQSLYFTPAYARIVSVIQVMAQADRAQARILWQRLETARPDQPLGRQLLGPLFSTGEKPETNTPPPSKE